MICTVTLGVNQTFMCNISCSVGKWVPEELRAFTKWKDDEPYVADISLLQWGWRAIWLMQRWPWHLAWSSTRYHSFSQDNSENLAETQEESCNIEEVNIASLSEQSVNEIHKRNSRKSDCKKNCKDESSAICSTTMSPMGKQCTYSFQFQT